MTREIQEKVIDTLVDNLGSKKSSFEYLQSRFGLGKSAVYNRMNLETPLTLDEFFDLAKTFNISIDHLLGQDSPLIQFKIPSLPQVPRTIAEYFDPIKQSMARLRQQPDFQVHYVTNEVPLFHYFYFPELTAFKFFIWARSIWNWEFIQTEKFSVDYFLKVFNLPFETQQLMSDYSQIPSTEFWNNNILSNTLNQIRYYHAAGAFKSEKDLEAVYNSLECLIDHAEQMSMLGQKFSPNDLGKRDSPTNFHLYFNPFIYTNNTILCTSSTDKEVFASYDNPNFLSSKDDRLVSYTLDWFINLKKRSTKISSESEKERVTFFRNLREQVARKRGQ